MDRLEGDKGEEERQPAVCADVVEEEVRRPEEGARLPVRVGGDGGGTGDGEGDAVEEAVDAARGWRWGRKEVNLRSGERRRGESLNSSMENLGGDDMAEMDEQGEQA